MPDKIKISIGVLAVIALVSFLSLLNAMGFGKMPSLATVLGQSSFGSPSDDVDGDGLPNADESYWNTDFQNPDSDGDGFLDGEEIKSGHDPIVAGPNDILLSQENMTQRLSGLAVAGLYTGDLSKDNPDFESSLAVLANTIVDETLEDFVKDIDPSKIKTTSPTESNQKEYLKDMQLYFQSLTQTHSDQLRAISKFAENKNSSQLAESLNSANNKLRDTIKDLYQMTVPKNWEKYHLSIIAWTASMASAGRSVIDAQEDPIKSTIAITALVNGHIDLSSIATSFHTFAQSQKIQ